MCTIASGGHVPRRLVEVSGSDSEMRLRLFNLAETPGTSAPKYAALSYCWGDPEI